MSLFDQYTEGQRTRSSPFGTFKSDSVKLELPFKCPHCGAWVREREELKAFKGHAKDKVYVEHLGRGCVFEPKSIVRGPDAPLPSGQVTLNDADEGGESGKEEID